MRARDGDTPTFGDAVGEIDRRTGGAGLWVIGSFGVGDGDALVTAAGRFWTVPSLQVEEKG